MVRSLNTRISSAWGLLRLLILRTHELFHVYDLHGYVEAVARRPQDPLLCNSLNRWLSAELILSGLQVGKTVATLVIFVVSRVIPV